MGFVPHGKAALRAGVRKPHGNRNVRRRIPAGEIMQDYLYKVETLAGRASVFNKIGAYINKYTLTAFRPGNSAKPLPGSGGAFPVTVPGMTELYS